MDKLASTIRGKGDLMQSAVLKSYPPGVPHEVCNVSDTEPVVAVVARSDASEWEHIVDYPSRRR